MRNISIINAILSDSDGDVFFRELKTLPDVI